MKNTRGKGLDFVREVKMILQCLGHQTEGPSYLIMQIAKEIDFNGVKKKITIPVQSHRDFFGVYDLISYDPKDKKFYFHQVSINEHRSSKINLIVSKGMRGNVWGRCSDTDRKVFYRVYHIEKDGSVIEGEVYYLASFRQKKEKKEEILFERDKYE